MIPCNIALDSFSFVFKNKLPIFVILVFVVFWSTPIGKFQKCIKKERGREREKEKRKKERKKENNKDKPVNERKHNDKYLEK